MRQFIYLAILFITISSCKPKIKYHDGWFPYTPVNMEDFNSIYDDYNSTAPTLGQTFPLCFSSNRNSYGNSFDVIYKLLSVQFYYKDDGEIEVQNYTDANMGVVIDNNIISTSLQKINTGFNEFSPYILSFDYDIYPNGWNYYNNQFLLLYANDENGNLDIRFTHNFELEEFAETQEIDFLNTEFDDAYPCFNKDFTAIYFTSNRDNNKFNIYTANFEKTENIIDNLSDTIQHIVKIDTVLSSAFDDKCPYILQDVMVFTSNRDGGYGGYDLYYSLYKDGQWTDPINFGSKINSEYDEFRPIIKPFDYNFKNDFMVFSSNRPGGKGGFDLYYVGIDKII